MSSTNTNPRAGFTLIELLVIAPIAVIIVAVIVLVMVNLVGDTLIAQQRNTASYETQSGLDQIEQDVRLSAAILQTTGALSSPQGSDQGTTAFTATTGTLNGSTNGPALLLKAYATTTDPMNSSRTLIYTNQPSASCTTPTANDPLTYTIVYYVKADPDNSSKMALWRRTIVPTTGTICSGTPWQKNSCFPGVAGALCITNDRMVVSNISSVVVLYYFETSNPYTVTTQTSLASASDNPTSVKVTINTSKTVGTKTITSAMSLYVSRINQ